MRAARSDFCRDGAARSANLAKGSVFRNGRHTLEGTILGKLVADEVDAGVRPSRMKAESDGLSDQKVGGATDSSGSPIYADQLADRDSTCFQYRRRFDVRSRWSALVKRGNGLEFRQ